MSRMELFSPNSPEYARAFKTLLHCTDERLYTKRLLADLFSAFPYDAVAVDWGAGNGVLTREMALWFRTVFAVEPNAALLNDLSDDCPNTILVPATIEDTTLPRPVDVGVMSHLLHSIPDHQWGEVCMKAATQLAQGGMLVIILKHFDAALSRMYEAFGAPNSGLNQVFAGLKHRPEYSVTFRATPGRFRTTTFAETLAIARCVMSDRPREVYAKLPTESAFRDYVRTHFWNETAQQGGWNCPQQFVLIHRNPFYSLQQTQTIGQTAKHRAVSGDRMNSHPPTREVATRSPFSPSYPVLDCPTATR